MIDILCIIPLITRKKKDLIYYNDRPLIVWTIEQALSCNHDMKIIVITDNNDIVSICNTYDVDTLFINREDVTNGLLLTDFDIINYGIERLKDTEGYNCDVILHLRPTFPERKISDINKCMDLFIKYRYKYDSLRSVVQLYKSPYKTYRLNEGNLIPLIDKVDNIEKPHDTPTQCLPKCYFHNEYIDIINESILKSNTISGDKILPYIMNTDKTYFV